jgi:hypothetical protein
MPVISNVSSRCIDAARLSRRAVAHHVHAAFLRRAVAEGAEQIQPPTDMFYGASSASLRDPFGDVWVLLTWQEDLAPAEMVRRQRAAGRGPS